MVGCAAAASAQAGITLADVGRERHSDLFYDAQNCAGTTEEQHPGGYVGVGQVE